jgi:hypothetical protein
MENIVFLELERARNEDIALEIYYYEIEDLIQRRENSRPCTRQYVKPQTKKNNFHFLFRKEVI